MTDDRSCACFSLYWVDQSLPGIRSCHTNGSGLAIVIQADVSLEARTFRDVTVYEVSMLSFLNSISNSPNLIVVYARLRHLLDNDTTYSINEQ